MDRKELLAAVSEAAAEDAKIKKMLMKDPKAALRRMGADIPDEMEIRVVEEKADVTYIVVPYNPEELTDQELDAVAGGWCVGHDVCGDFCVKKMF